MGKIFAVAFVVAIAFGASSPVEARGGCGPGFHPGPYGHHCFRNAGAVVLGPSVAVGVPGIGVFVTGHGYWDGHRYWGRRYRWHGGWRYR